MRFLANDGSSGRVWRRSRRTGCGSSSGSGGSGGSGSTGSGERRDGRLAGRRRRGAAGDQRAATSRWSVGATWVYNVTDTGVAYTKNSAVESPARTSAASRPAPWATRCSETIKTSTQLTWYEVDRHRRAPPPRPADWTPTACMTSEDWYTPYDLRVDESPDHLMAGAAWTMTLHGRAHLQPASRPRPRPSPRTGPPTPSNEAVTVPAGTFSALKITRTNTADGTAKSQWFVPGVGKIRESNTTGHLEELTSYMIPDGERRGVAALEGRFRAPAF